MGNEKCQGCDLYENGSCRKFRKNGRCEISTRKWLIREKYDEPMNFISVERMCRMQSIFGNEFIGLSTSDIERLKNGEIIHIGGEYGTFIGFIDEEREG